MLLAPLRWALRIAILVVAVIVLYFAVTLVQVWLTSRQYDPHPAGAILVMGAAQYDCVPSPDLQARLDQAAILYHQGYAHLIMVTGSKQPGDKCTEAQSGAMYLEQVKGVPSSAILEAGGNDSYENIADAAAGADRPRRPGGAGHHRPLPRGPLHGHRLGPVADAVAHADPDLAHHGLVDGALLLEGGARRGPGPDHRLQPPGVAARRLSERVSAACRGGGRAVPATS